jgi:hypothetical protein
MPLGSYFIGVGAVLLGLLFLTSQFSGYSEQVQFVTTDMLPVSATIGPKGSSVGRLRRDDAASAFAFQDPSEAVASGHDATAIDRNNHSTSHNHSAKSQRSSKRTARRHETARRSSRLASESTW